MKYIVRLIIVKDLEVDCNNRMNRLPFRVFTFSNNTKSLELSCAIWELCKTFDIRYRMDGYKFMDGIRTTDIIMERK